MGWGNGGCFNAFPPFIAEIQGRKKRQQKLLIKKIVGRKVYRCKKRIIREISSRGLSTDGNYEL